MRVDYINFFYINLYEHSDNFIKLMAKCYNVVFHISFKLESM